MQDKREGPLGTDPQRSGTTLLLLTPHMLEARPDQASSPPGPFKRNILSSCRQTWFLLNIFFAGLFVTMTSLLFKVRKKIKKG